MHTANDLTKWLMLTLPLKWLHWFNSIIITRPFDRNKLWNNSPAVLQIFSRQIRVALEKHLENWRVQWPSDEEVFKKWNLRLSTFGAF